MVKIGQIGKGKFVKENAKKFMEFYLLMQELLGIIDFQVFQIKIIGINLVMKGGLCPVELVPDSIYLGCHGN